MQLYIFSFDNTRTTQVPLLHIVTFYCPTFVGQLATATLGPTLLEYTRKRPDQHGQSVRRTSAQLGGSASPRTVAIRAASVPSYAGAHTALAPCRQHARHAILRRLCSRKDLRQLLSMDEEEILHGGMTGRRDSQLLWLGWTRMGQR